MKKALYILSFLLITFSATATIMAQTDDSSSSSTSEIVKVEANASKGFSYPYYFYVPKALREAQAQQQKKNQTNTILVIPNNTGKVNDDLNFHEANVKKRMEQNASLAQQLNVAILMPVFPRPETDWKIYTHALDRDALLTEKAEYKRFDLQLASMIEDAQARLKAENLKFDKKVFITGFSASAMFANRFTFLHPALIKAAAIGSPGGWAIAPTAKFKDKTLRYPIGTGDLKQLTGEKFDLKSVRKVSMFIYLGDEDDNDSVVFGDGYETEDKDLIFELFGKTPVERWEISKKLYAENGLQAEFKLYPKVKHAVTKEIFADIFAFFAKHK